MTDYVAPTEGGVRYLAPPPPSRLLSTVALATAIVTTIAFWYLAFGAFEKVGQFGGGERTASLLVLGAICVGATGMLIPATSAIRRTLRSRRAIAEGDMVLARRHAAAARLAGWRTFGFALAALIVLGFILFLLTNNAAIVRTFLYWPQISRSFVNVLIAFEINAKIALISEVLILVWALSLALARLLPGPAALPIRVIAVAYIDFFRAIPSLVLIYLIAFGLPIANIPVLNNLPLTWYVILALSVNYSAYMAELFRAGIESVHPSQTAASHSLGLSTYKTWRYVVVPQAFRRLTPPLLSYFVGLQKDTALVSIVGLVDAFGQAKIYSVNYFNLSAVTLVAIIFFVITIPQTRLVDRMILRQARKTGLQQL